MRRRRSVAPTARRSSTTFRRVRSSTAAAAAVFDSVSATADAAPCTFHGYGDGFPQALVNTYLDGAGVFAWQENDQGTGNEPLALPGMTKARELDTVLRRIASEIRRLRKSHGGKAPPPVVPASRAVDPSALAPDPADD